MDNRRNAGATDGGNHNPDEAPGGRHLSPARIRRPLIITAITLAAVLLAGLVFVGVQVARLQGNLLTQPLNLGADKESALPVDASKDPLQILILGTDTRTGQDGASRDDSASPGAGNSDVMMLMHLSADRERVSVVSFPRDLLVPIPSCYDPDSENIYEGQDLGQLNSALNQGGPGCTVAAINELTDLQIDHFMMADFNAVKELSKTLGGVDVCVNQPVDDPYSGLTLPAGVSSIEGADALAFLRTRHGFGDGGDQGRIRAQQSFMASMARKVREEGTLSNLPKMYAIAQTITKNLTIDDGLSNVTSLLKIADRLKNVDLAKVSFITVPTVPYALNPNRLVLDTDKAEDLFAVLAADRPLDQVPAPSPSSTEQATSPSSAAASPGTEAPSDSTATASPPQTDDTSAQDTAPSFDPAAVPIAVTNASGHEERAEELQEILVDLGYIQAVARDSTAASPTTQVFFSPGYQQIAQAVAEEFGIPRVQVLASDSATGVVLEVGKNFPDGRKLHDAGELGPDFNGQTADQVTCQS